ncbi:MAG: 16S rRNA processing protein RimM [Alphaproteobacteria bacterium 16-39-46]|nr:MAG: 16S rRNA processing protein RimM [Alphaproteobacteria bacterium 16-39-46]OZA41467.1 MAG: 16S rRNA processing protein RimM [Alphaproteobacteria bacterium 17-39-52]HQS84720.1 ribosome maturation factor RimM [Alphaproteobacteria bacterium]HQS94506.1 ribosome maturation factor RimM [Alphaproteobacteria bacterium]
MTIIPAPLDSDLVYIAQIVGGHGIHGVLKIQCFLDNPHDFKLYSPIFNTSGKKYLFDVLSITPKHILARLDGIHDRTEADTLKGLKLYIERRALKSLSEEEYYQRDLLGAAVLNTERETIGKLLHIHNYGAQDILDISLNDGTMLLVPFQKDIVPEVSPDPAHPEKGFLILESDYLASALTPPSHDPKDR